MKTRPKCCPHHDEPSTAGAPQYTTGQTSETINGIGRDDDRAVAQRRNHWPWPERSYRNLLEIPARPFRPCWSAVTALDNGFGFGAGFAFRWRRHRRRGRLIRTQLPGLAPYGAETSPEFRKVAERFGAGAAQRSAEQSAIMLGFLICDLSVGGNTDPARCVHAKTWEPSWGLFEFIFILISVDH
jgi:hypothetical protein